MVKLTVSVPLPGGNDAGYVKVSASLRYDQKSNETIVQTVTASARVGNGPGMISRATVDVSFWPTDNPSVSESASMNVSNVLMPAFSGALNPVPLRLPHQLHSPVKQVRMRVSFSIKGFVSNLPVNASGSDERVFMSGLESIIHVGDLIGSLYVAIDGKWHIGVIHAADGGKFYPSVGYILSAPEKGIEVTYDDAGNVFISGMRVTHDGDGNVFLVGATVVDDGDGHITIK